MSNVSASRLSTVAIHEAAHAAAAIRLGLAIQCVRVDRPHYDTLGQLTFVAGEEEGDDGLDALNDDNLLRVAVVGLVGYMVDGTPASDWPPRWPVHIDELEGLGLIVDLLKLDEPAWDALVQTARDLVAHPDFHALTRQIQGWLQTVPVLHREDLDALQKAVQLANTPEAPTP